MFSLILSVGLSILFAAIDFGLAPFQAIFMMDIGKQVVMDQVDNTLEETVDAILDDIFAGF